MSVFRTSVLRASLVLHTAAVTALARLATLGGVPAGGRRRTDQRGEGVISAAIAVLVMAFLGVLMWVAFKGIFTKAAANTDRQVTQIGG